MNALKQLPWRSLFLAAILAVIIVKAFDFSIAQGLSALSPDATILKLLVTPAGGLLLFGCGGLAIGGLGVLCLERFGNVRFIHANTLWALTLSLLVTLWLISRLPVDGLGFATFSETHLFGVIIGVFWRGQDYWR
jgi:hypothetical protein